MTMVSAVTCQSALGKVAFIYSSHLVEFNDSRSVVAAVRIPVVRTPIGVPCYLPTFSGVGFL